MSLLTRNPIPANDFSLSNVFVEKEGEEEEEKEEKDEEEKEKEGKGGEEIKVNVEVLTLLYWLRNTCLINFD